MIKHPLIALRELRGFAVVAMLITAPVIRAQDSAFSSPAADNICVVGLVDIDPRQADQALALLRAYRDASSRAPGVRRFEVLRELARPNHFTLLETWDSEAARQAHDVSAATKKFRVRLQPLLASPFDERLCHPES